MIRRSSGTAVPGFGGATLRAGGAEPLSVGLLPGLLTLMRAALAEARKVEAADAAARDQIAREQIRDKPKPVRSRERGSP